MSDLPLQSGERQSLLEHWKTIITAQMHFNDMLMRTRSLAATVVIGVFGAAAALVGQYPTRQITVCCKSVHISVVVNGFGLVLLVSVFLLDYAYYYRLLLAAVERGEVVETELSKLVPEPPSPSISLTLCLSHRVSRRHAKAVLWLFYGIPFIAGTLFFLYLFAWYEVSP